MCEQTLERLLDGIPVQTRRTCANRLPARLAESEDEALAEDHPRSRYGSAWVSSGKQSLNTLRMLRKMRGAGL